MKVFLVFILCWIWGVSLGDPIPNPTNAAKDYHTICSTECSVSKDFENRILRLKLKSTDEDLCYLRCAGRVLKIIEDHKYNIHKLRTLYGSHKIVIPDGFKDLEDISDTDPNFVDQVANWIDKNKEASLELVDYLTRNTKAR